jgi:hypothetical protein
MKDLHRGLGVLVLEEELDPALARALRRLADSVDEARPAVGVRRLERVVVALDSGPEDEVGAELAGEVDGVERALHRLVADGVVRRREPPFAEERIEVQARTDRVDVATVERVADVVEVVRRQLVRVVELVPVDRVAEPLDRARDTLRSRLVAVLGLVAQRDEPRDHRPESPDAE